MDVPETDVQARKILARVQLPLKPLFTALKQTPNVLEKNHNILQSRKMCWIIISV